MADRLQKGHSDGSDNGGNGTLQGFELNRKIEGVEVGCVSAGHSRFNCMSSESESSISREGGALSQKARSLELGEKKS